MKEMVSLCLRVSVVKGVYAPGFPSKSGHSLSPITR